MSRSEADATLHRPLGDATFAARSNFRGLAHPSGTTVSPSLIRTRPADTAIRRIATGGEDERTDEFHVHPATQIAIVRQGSTHRDHDDRACDRERAVQREETAHAQSQRAPHRHLAIGKLRPLPRPPWWTVIAALAAVAGLMWWMTAQRLPAIDTRYVIEANLSAASLAIREDRLTEPLQHSAVHYYGTVLAIDPTNDAALAGLRRIADLSVENAKNSILSARFADAVDAIEHVRRARPDDRRLPHLETQLSRALENHVLAIGVSEPGVKGSTDEARSAANLPATQVIDSATPKTSTTPRESSSDQRPGFKARSTDARPKSVIAANNAQSVPSFDGLQRDVEVLGGKLVRDARPAIEQAVSALAARLLSQAREIGLDPLQIGTTERELHAARTAIDTVQVDARVEPKLIGVVEPRYPRAARVRNIEGWVDLNLSVTPEGKVEDAHVLRREGSKLFERAALAAVRQWHYEPMTLGDPDARQSVEVRVAFQLEE